MKRAIAVGLIGALLFTAQAACAQDVESQPVGSPAYCQARWQREVSDHATGGVSFEHFMRGCVVRRGGDFAEWGGDKTPFFLLIGGGIGLIALIGSTRGHHESGSPASP